MDALRGRVRHLHDSLSVNVFGFTLSGWLLLGVVLVALWGRVAQAPVVPHPDDLSDPAIAAKHEVDGGRHDIEMVREAMLGKKATPDHKRHLRLYKWAKDQERAEQAHLAEQATFVRWAGGLLGGTGLLVLLAGLWVRSTRPVRYRLDRRWLELGERRFLIEDQGGLVAALDELARYRPDPELREAVEHAHDVLRGSEELSRAQHRALADLRH